MPDKVHHTLDEVLAALAKGHTEAAAAHILGCSYQTILNYRKRWKAVDDAVKAHRKEMVSLAETGLRGAILNSQPWAIAFTLKTLGKDEGYGDSPVKVALTDPTGTKEYGADTREALHAAERAFLAAMGLSADLGRAERDPSSSD